MRKPFNITNNAIRVVTGLCSSSDLPTLKFMKNQLVTNTIGSRFDKGEIMINDILEYDVIFSSMVIGYKIYHSRQENSVFGNTIHAPYGMIKENIEYDLCEFL